MQRLTPRIPAWRAALLSRAACSLPVTLIVLLAGCAIVDPTATATLESTDPRGCSNLPSFRCREILGHAELFPPRTSVTGDLPYLQVKDLRLPGGEPLRAAFYDADHCDLDPRTAALLADFGELVSRDGLTGFVGPHPTIFSDRTLLAPDVVDLLVGSILVLDVHRSERTSRDRWLACGVLLEH